MRRLHRAVHRRVWQVLAIVLPLLVVVAIGLRPAGPTEAPPIQLAPP